MEYTLKFLLLINVLLLILLKVGSVKGQDESCNFPDGMQYVCKSLFECKKFMEDLRVVKLPVSNEIKQNIRNFVCGYEGSVPKVCCGTQLAFAHPNLQLLMSDVCGASTGERIVGGSVASLNEFPWMALLSYRTKNGKIEFLCGGSLISKRYVLTAAHCLTENLIGVRLGEHDLLTTSDCVEYLDTSFCAPPVQEISIEEVTIHEAHSKQEITNDIGLIRLAADVNYTQLNALPICLPIYEHLMNHKIEGTDAIVTGWGITEKFTPSTKLMKLSLKMLTNDECKEKYQSFSDRHEAINHITEYKVCAGVKNSDSCRGDSGGPLILLSMYEGRARYVQYGIVSYGHNVCGDGIPGVYTRITKYLGWILDNLKP